MILYLVLVLGMVVIIVSLLYNLLDDKYRRIVKDLEDGKWENGFLE